jgi:hypothetical protein
MGNHARPAGADPAADGATATNYAIRRELARLNHLPYDHDGHGALPQRTDSYLWAADHLCADPRIHDRPAALRAWGVGPPHVELGADGTVVIAFAVADRRLTLHVITKRVVLTHCTWGPEGARTAIEGRLPGTPHGDREELDALISWLREGVSRCPES